MEKKKNNPRPKRRCTTSLGRFCIPRRMDLCLSIKVLLWREWWPSLRCGGLVLVYGAGGSFFRFVYISSCSGHLIKKTKN